MNIYTLDNEGYIVSIKSVGKNYIMNSNDFEGEAPFKNNCHYITGLEKPKTQEQLNQEEINELNEWLDLRRNIEHPDKASKQARLLELLG